MNQITHADKEEFLEFFIQELDKGVDDEYFFSEGQARVLSFLGFELPVKIDYSVNGNHTHTIKFTEDKEVMR